MWGLTLSALAFAASASADIPVEVGRFDPGSFPDLIVLDRRMPHAEMTRRVQEILGDGRCRLDGQTERRFDITVPYAALMDNRGQVRRVVIKEIGCAPIESLVGQIVLAQSERGDFEILHRDGERWYASELYFAEGEPVFAAGIENKDKVICKREEQPMIGTRLRFKKTCKTAAEWQAFENDRRQLKRDLGNSAACSNSASCTSF